MTKFTIDIADKECCEGITKAREHHNASLTPERDVGQDGVAVERAINTHPDYLATDDEYVQHVMARAAESYRQQFAKCPTCGASKL